LSPRRDRRNLPASGKIKNKQLQIFIARELYGLSLDDWKHLTDTFTFGNGETKAELDEIIRLSLMLWAKAESATSGKAGGLR
jgi:hypothetical protein